MKKKENRKRKLRIKTDVTAGVGSTVAFSVCLCVWTSYAPLGDYVTSPRMKKEEGETVAQTGYYKDEGRRGWKNGQHEKRKIREDRKKDG